MPSQSTTPLRLTFKPGVGLILLIALMIFGLTVTSFLVIFLQKLNNPAAALRIGAVIQDLLVFIIPAIATAMLATRLPARFLRLDKKVNPGLILLGILSVVFAMPAINLIVSWNNSITLPESMSQIETLMREMENAAEVSINMLMGGTSPASLIIAILIIGILAGFSEEIFFRGAMQRLLGFAINKHAAILITAFIFSAIHFQFYGFFARFILGALFGYLYYWSGSLIVPVTAHIFNNTVVVVFKWLAGQGVITSSLDDIGTTASSSDIAALCLSVILTAITIYFFIRISTKENERIQD